MNFDSDTNSSKDPINLLPRFYRTDSNKKFFNSTLTPLIQPGTVKKISSFIGRQYSKSTTASDVFLTAADDVRQSYQLEAAAIIKNDHDDIVFFKDYIDHINQLGVFGSNTSNHERLNQQEMYSWDPHISWDKFVNYQDYYWQPQGPKIISIFGQQKDIRSTYNISMVDDSGTYSYIFGTTNAVRNPDITLYRGQTYVFNIDTPNNPFCIKDSRMMDIDDSFNSGLSANKLDNGTIIFKVGRNTPDLLYYSSSTNPNIGGIFKIFNIEENTSLNVEEDLLDKIEYTMSNGTKLSNGMKVKFVGETYPEKYKLGAWYVEGVGRGIRLISEHELAITGSYVGEISALFDNEAFDTTSFGSTSSKPTDREYIVISRDSPDRNQWCRVNKWFHKDVLSISEELNGGYFDLDQTSRAVRPIIEFNTGLKLFNFGHQAKQDVELIDTHTTDIFSKIEGSTGYYVDGEQLADNMRVLFTADTDVRVKNKIYTVKFVNVDIPGRQITFNANDINIIDNTINFSIPHGLIDSFPITYLSNGNPLIDGLVNRKIYYPKIKSETSITLYTDPELSTEFTLTARSSGDQMFELFEGRRKQITLLETDDSVPVDNETIFVRLGHQNQGNMYWYTDGSWKLGQQKTLVNQAPLFDIVDDFGNSLSDATAYPQSDFTGTKVFSYKTGTGVDDAVLGFPLSYRNINNIGDISFTVDIMSDVVAFINPVTNTQSHKQVGSGYLTLINSLGSTQYINGWTHTERSRYQPVIRIFKESGLVNNFPIDMYDHIQQSIYLDTRVYINGYKLDKSAYRVSNKMYRANITSVLYENDIIELQCSILDINGTITKIKTYQQGNPILTKSIDFTLGIVDDDISNAQINFSITVNGRVLSNDEFGVQVSSNAKYIVINDSVTINDIVTIKCFSSLPKNEMGFYEIPPNLQNNPLNENITELTLGQIVDHVGSILDNMSDYINLRDVGYISKFGTKIVQHTGSLNLCLYHICSKETNVIEALNHARNDYHAFKVSFLNTISNTGVDMDANNHVDYALDELFKNTPKTSKYYLSDMFAHGAYITTTIEVLDARTNLYPLPSSFNLATLSNKSILIYLNGEQLIHGLDYTFTHDNFVTISAPHNKHDIIEIREYNSTDGAVCPPTPTKLGLYPKFEPKIYVDTSLVTPVNVIQGHDGSITRAFNDYRDELILELEKRIFNNIKIEYDPSIFNIHDYLPGYSRSNVYDIDEINQVMSPSFYNWIPHVKYDYTKNVGYIDDNFFTHNYKDRVTPDNKPAPAYWRGVYRYILDTDRPHLCPWEMLGMSIQPDWWEEVYGPAPYTKNNSILWDDLKNGIIREPNKPITVNPKYVRPLLEYYIPVGENGELVDPDTAAFIHGSTPSFEAYDFKFGDCGPVESAWRRSSEFPFAIISTALLLRPAHILGTCIDRHRIVKNKCNQFIYSDTGLRLKLADLKTPSTIINDNRIYTSGLINYISDYIYSELDTKLSKYAYDRANLTNQLCSRIGGFTAKEKYNIILDSKSPSSTGGTFVPEENYDIMLNTSSTIRKAAYSGIRITKLEYGYEISGYNLDEPYFKYHTFLNNDRVINVGGVSENFVVWQASQNYVAGKVVQYQNRYYRVMITHNSNMIFDEQYYARLPSLPLIGGIEVTLKKTVDSNGYRVLNYGTVLNNIQEISDFIQGYGSYLVSEGFIFENINAASSGVYNWESSIKDFLFWASQSWDNRYSISLSPASNALVISTNNSVVDNIFDEFYGYKIYDSKGIKIDSTNISTYRTNQTFSVSPKLLTTGIYGATIYFIQKEHVLVLDNKTIFNDLIYDTTTGYKQDRVKIIGYVSTNWGGGFNIPGFVYDEAVIYDWSPWEDYDIGNVVRYKSVYYSAKHFVGGAAAFDPDDWVLLPEEPVTKLLPNLDYRAKQFADFYDLETDNFDAQQQKMAQHLIGYQKRTYLSNIINDDVSQYKFYQGMIVEKGTQNVLNKLFDVLSADNEESVKFDEEWAVRTGRYGATHIYDEIEFILDKNKFKIKPQPVLLIGQLPSPEPLDYIYRIPTDQLYIKPTNYTPNFWKYHEKDPRYLRSVGYVRYVDVDYAIHDLSSILTTNPELYHSNQYVWCGFEGRSWDVYRINEMALTISQMVITPSNITISFDETQVFKNDIIILVVGGVNTFYQIDPINAIQTSVITISSDEFMLESEEIYPTSIMIFTSCRFSTELEADNSGELKTWIDPHADKQWMVKINSENGVKIQQGIPAIDIDTIKKVLLYNDNNDILIDYLDVIDIPNGKLPGIAEQELKYKTFYDPAIYNKGDAAIVLNDGLSWNKNKVGELWWDLSTAKYIINQDTDVVYRASTWNQLYKTASIDIYEWVESAKTPDEWDAVYRSGLGDLYGISGLSKYGNSAYTIVEKYDSVAEIFYNKYYFWVKNKETLPENPNRRLSAASISQLLTSPETYGYRCISMLGDNSFVLCNLDNIVNGSNIHLLIEYWTGNSRDINVHGDWRLIGENSNTIIPQKIEQKWLASLIGIDSNDNQLPNYSLPVKMRYGIEDKPLQGMFIDRLSALKQFVNNINAVLKANYIVDNYDISGLFDYDPVPTLSSRRFDHRIDTKYELKYIDTANIVNASASISVLNGKIINITINNGGKGYINPPDISISAKHGAGAKFDVKLDTVGTIFSVGIIDSGYEYDDDATVTIRPNSVLINSDESNDGIWAMYGWDPISATWIEQYKQSYDTTKYWSYIDWYDAGYDQFTKVDHVVSATNDLMLKSFDIGKIIKVANAGIGGWILAKKISDESSVDYTKNYTIVGRYHGTIQLSDRLYTYDKSMFKTNVPDPYASHVKIELRNIINSLRDSILIGDMRIHYVNQFFNSVRFILSEQPFVDWIFKTSFVKATHQVGPLKQKITYNNDNLQNFEDYIAEVKPYRTKIREYISAYTSMDDAHTVTTDFDLPTDINSDKSYYSIPSAVTPAGIELDDQYKTLSPWQAWFDNIGFSIVDIKVIDGGSGYITAPGVNISGGFGKDAAATAYIHNGKVTNIRVVAEGTGFLWAPTIELYGGYAVTGRSATAIAIIDKSKIRSNKITLKYDRISSVYEMSKLDVTEQFDATYGKLQYPLYWSPQLNRETVTVLINGREALIDQFSLSNKQRVVSGFTRHYGVLSFSQSLNTGDKIIINYLKDFNHLPATDRINYYYSPITGGLGKDLSQLMIGVDYSGTIVTGAAFKASRGWDTVEWDSDIWDSFEPSDDVHSAVVNYGTTKLSLPYITSPNDELNVYIDDIRVDNRYNIQIIPGDDYITIPADAYEVSVNRPQQVVSQYKDTNIVIMSQSVTMLSTDVIIDSFNATLFKSARYQVQVLFDKSYTFDIVVFHNGVNAGLHISETADSLSFSTLGTFLVERDINDDSILNVILRHELPNFNDMRIVVIKWLFTGGNMLVAQTDGINDTNFILSSDTIVAVPAETHVLDEFIIDDFYSGCYYIQLISGTATQVCEVEILHNGDSANINLADQYIIIDNETSYTVTDENTLAIFSVDIVDDSLRLMVSTQQDNTSIVYSRILLAGYKYNPIRNDDIRRLASDQFVLTPFDFELQNKETVIVDRFDFLKCTSARYQILILSDGRAQSVDAIASVHVSQGAGNFENLLTITNNLSLGLDCGFFSATISNNEYHLLFTPTCNNILLNGIKIMMGHSYYSIEHLLYDNVFTFDKINTKVLTGTRTEVDRFSKIYHGCQYQIQLMHNNVLHSLKLSVIHDSVTIDVMQYADIQLSDALGYFDADFDEDNVILFFNPSIPSVDVMMLRTLIGDHSSATTVLLSNDTFYIRSDTAILLNAPQVEIARFNCSLVDCVQYYFLIKSGDYYQTAEVHVAHNNSVVDTVTYAIQGAELGTFTAELNNGYVTVLFTGYVPNADIYWVESAISKNNLLSIIPDSTVGLSGRSMLISSKSLSTTGLSPVIVDTLDIKDSTGGFYRIFLSSGSNIMLIELHVAYDSINLASAQYSIMTIGNECGGFECVIVDSQAQIIFTPSFDTVKLVLVQHKVNSRLSNIDVSGTNQAPSNFEEFYNFNNTSTITVIKSHSDGSLPGNPFAPDTDVEINGYDANIIGGQFSPNSETMVGFRPDDLVIDGDQFVNNTLPSAPEEVLPGCITDVVAIKVYHRPRGGSPTISYKNYISDGVTKIYGFNQPVLSDRSVLVKIRNIILSQDVDYTMHRDISTTIGNDSLINYIELHDGVASIGDVISIISIGIGSEYILDSDSFTPSEVAGAGATLTEYVTHASWLNGEISATVMIDGILSYPELFRTGYSSSSPDMVGLRFGTPVATNSNITYVIERNDASAPEQTLCIPSTQPPFKIEADKVTYDLTILTASVLANQSSEPYTNSVIVKIGNKILNPNPVFYFTMRETMKPDGTLSDGKTFRLPKWRSGTSIINSKNIEVYKNDKRTYRFSVDDINDVTTITMNTYTKNAKIVISINQGADYTINPDGTITFSDYIQQTNIGELVEVISFYNHLVLHSERTTDYIRYNHSIVPGNVDYIDYTTKFGRYFVLRHPILSVEYVWVIKNGVLLTHDVDYVLEDDYQTVKLASSVSDHDVIQIMSFGDRMVGRFGYMQFKDTIDRTHYKRMNGAKATKLAQDLKVTDIMIHVSDASKLSSPSGVIEINGERIEYRSVSNNSLGGLSRGTLGTGTPYIHRVGLTVLDIGVSENLPYKDDYVVDSMITKRTLSNIPLKYAVHSKDEIDVFVGGRKLIKDDFDEFDESRNFPYSPEGNVIHPAEFSIKKDSRYIKMTEPVRRGINVSVIKKLGKVWTETDKPLADSNTPVANFLKHTETIWPQYLMDKYQDTILSDSLDAITSDDNNVLEGD
jgi:hypothetical protein